MDRNYFNSKSDGLYDISKAISYAEIGWTPKVDRNWDEYKIRLESQGERMKNEGINYYRDGALWEMAQ